jgi:hypothetical protein
MENEKPTEQPSSSRDRVRRFRERKRKSNELATQRISPSAVRLALEEPVERVHYPIRIPVIPAGVVPSGTIAQVAMDSEPAYECARLAMDAGPQFGSQLYAYSNIEGFPGYPYLMLLALRSEYRNMATALATELTRKWIKFNSTDTEDESTKTKITEIEQAFTALGIQGIIRKAAEHDAFYGTGQILINIKGADLKTPLIIDSRTVKKDSLIGFKNVDPIWTTPLMYNSLTPSSPNFYRPDSWWVMGEHWDASRVIVTVTREVPDIFKPAFNFSGMSLSQLAEPYVNNWLRTRQSVSDLINNFSIVVLKTAMDQVLTGGDDGSNLFSRIKLFTATRSNKGVMALDKDREELEQIAVPLGGLHELQSQALEQLCVVSREPATVLTGITPSGFGNVAEGEVRIWYDYIHAQQEAHWRDAIDKMFKIVQMSMYGAIDPEITFEFVPLYEMTEEQESTIRVNDSIRAGNLIDRGVIDAQEERERLARDPESGYQGIDISKEIAPPDEAEESANLARGTDSALGYDADFVESEHPKDDDGKFGSGVGAKTAPSRKTAHESVMKVIKDLRGQGKSKEEIESDPTYKTAKEESNKAAGFYSGARTDFMGTSKRRSEALNIERNFGNGYTESVGDFIEDSVEKGYRVAMTKSGKPAFVNSKMEGYGAKELGSVGWEYAVHLCDSLKGTA